MAFDYEIRRTEALMIVRVEGRFSMRAIRTLEQEFWQCWEPSLNRILMDYRGLTTIDLAVREFTQAGLDSQAEIPVQGDRVRAAYVSASDVVFGFTRIIEQVWEDHVSVTATRDLGGSARLPGSRAR